MSRSLMYVLIAIAAGAVEAAQPQTAIPKEIPGTGSAVAPYVWIDAEALVDDKGKIDSSKLGEAGMRVLENYAKHVASRLEPGTLSTSVLAGSDPCGGVATSFPPMEEYRPTSTLADLLKESSDILAGEVVAAREGAFNGSIGSLLRLKVTRALRDSNDVKGTDGTVLLVYPYATLRLQERTYCARPISVEGILPPLAPGDRVVLFNYSPGLGRDHSVIQVDVARRLIIEHGGSVTIPAGLRPALHGANFDEVLAELSVRMQSTDTGYNPLRGGHAN